MFSRKKRSEGLEKALNKVNTHKFRKNQFLLQCTENFMMQKWKISKRKGRTKTTIFHAVQPQKLNHERIVRERIVRLVGKLLTYTHT